MDSSFNRLTMNNKTKINKFIIFTKDCGVIFKNYDDSAAIYTKKDDTWVKEIHNQSVSLINLILFIFYPF
jgi:hypothetical protein